MGVLQYCKPRDEVMKGDLADALFAASLGDVVNCRAADVYQDAARFFDNTHAAVQLKRIVQAVFQCLADPTESGGLVRLSTGFGGGKSHTLIALWHLARNVSDFSLGAELVPAAMRPKAVSVAAVDGEGAGVPDFATHADATTHSLAGEIAYRLGGPKAVAALGAADSPVGSPNSAQIEAMLPEGPTLILLDEIVTYMAKLDAQGRGNLKGFLSSLASVVRARKQAVLVVTDPAAQQAYEKESREVDEAFRAAVELDQMFGRKFSEFDPIKDEGPQVISKRLFERIDEGAAQGISATYKALYERVAQDPEASHYLPKSALDQEFIQRFVVCYPFHPRLIETAQNRLSTMPDYHRGRGTLRLFARLIRDAWERGEDIEIIDAGEVDWSSDRIQADLLQRLNRDSFKAVVDADIRRHAAELDGKTESDRPVRGHHTRVASALLLESLPMNPNAAMSVTDVTLATLRPEDAGHEPKEALDRLVGRCWYTYPTEGGGRYQFRIEPNVNRQIEERIMGISDEDAKSLLRTRLQRFYTGSAFQTCPWPDTEAAVPKTSKPVLVLTDDLELAKRIVQYEGTTDDGHKVPRVFVNNLVVISIDPHRYSSALDRAKRLLAAESLQEEAKKGTGDALAQKQLQEIVPSLRKQANIEALRAFCKLLLHKEDAKNGSGYSEHSITEEILASDEKCMAPTGGQADLKQFLENKDLMYRHDDCLDTSLFLDRVVSGTPEHEGQSGVYTSAALYERMLSIPGLKLLGDANVFRATIRKAVAEGSLVVRDASGRVFDKDGSVIEGVRYTQELVTVAPSHEMLVALASSDLVKEWTKVADEENGEAVPPPPPPPPTDVHTTWEDIIRVAGERKLEWIELRANTPADAATMAIAAVELGPSSQVVNVDVRGALKDSGHALLRLENVQPNHPLRDLPAKVYAALDPSRLEAVFRLRMKFEDGSGPEMQESLERARQALFQKETLDRIGVEARFCSE